MVPAIYEFERVQEERREWQREQIQANGGFHLRIYDTTNRISKRSKIEFTPYRKTERIHARADARKVFSNKRNSSPPKNDSS